MGFFKDWRETGKYQIGQPLTNEQIEKLNRVVKTSQTIKTVLGMVWACIAGVCSIIASVFSVLAFFK